MKNSIIVLLLCMSWTLKANNGQELFNSQGFLGAKQEAISEGKFQLLEFVAKWCLPCKHMDQTTFTDAHLQAYMKKHFASAKVDIDHFDGFALKEQYGIKFLPSILVLDDEGNVLARWEEAMGPTALRKNLEEVVARYDKPLARSVTHIQYPPSSLQEDTTSAASVHTDLQTKPEKRIFVTEKAILQFGVFGSLANATKLYDRVTLFLPSAPEINTLNSNGKTVYAIQYGPFENEAEAHLTQKEMQAEGFSCIVKKMN